MRKVFIITKGKIERKEGFKRGKGGYTTNLGK